MKSQRKVVAIGAGALVCVGMLGVRWWLEGADAETLELLGRLGPLYPKHWPLYAIYVSLVSTGTIRALWPSERQETLEGQDEEDVKADVSHESQRPQRATPQLDEEDPKQAVR